MPKLSYEGLKIIEAKLRRARQGLLSAGSDLRAGLFLARGANLLAEGDVATDDDLRRLAQIAGQVNSLLATLAKREIGERIIDEPQRGRITRWPRPPSWPQGSPR